MLEPMLDEGYDNMNNFCGIFPGLCTLFKVTES